MEGSALVSDGSEIREALPGFLFVVLPVTIVAEILWVLEISAKKTFFIDIFIAAVLAVIVGNMFTLPARLQPGLMFSTKWFLRAGIIIYGLKFSYKSLANGGLADLIVVVVSVVVGVAVAMLCGRLFGVNPRTSALIGTGTAICGVAAAMATAPSIKAKADEIGVALATILFWGTLGLFVYPFIGHGLGISNSVYGAWSGAALHDLPQIIAAAQQGGGATGLKFALLVKLIRVAFIVVIVMFMSAWFAMKEGADVARQSNRSVARGALRQFPLFVAAFFVVVLINTFIAVPSSIAGPLATYPASITPVTVSGLFLTFAIVGICARVTRPVIAAAGPRAMALALVTWVTQSVLVLITAQALLPHLR